MFGREERGDESETEELRRAMAEAIWEMEREGGEEMHNERWEEEAERYAAAREAEAAET